MYSCLKLYLGIICENNYRFFGSFLFFCLNRFLDSYRLSIFLTKIYNKLCTSTQRYICIIISVTSYLIINYQRFMFPTQQHKLLKTNEDNMVK